MVDVFRGMYVPAHLATREFFELCRRRLEPGGVLALNVASPNNSGQLVGAVATTLARVFPNVVHVRLSTIGPFASIVLFASDREIEQRALGWLPPTLRDLGIELEPIEVPTAHRRVLTDDHAPVEWLTDLALLDALVAPAPER